MQTVGAIICVLAALRLIRLGFSTVRARAERHAACAQSLAIRDKQTAPRKATRVPHARQPDHWHGYRTFQVAKKVAETSNTASLYLLPHDKKKLPEYQPGQYLTFRFQLPGDRPDEQKSVVRCYSLSDAPHEDYFRITVKRVPSPPGTDHRPGQVSNHIHDNVDAGDLLEVQAPRGDFALDPRGTDPVVLVAGGVGVTPMLSMLNAIVLAGSDRDVWFFYGVRNSEEHIMQRHLQILSSEHANVHLYVCYSEPSAGDKAAQNYHHTGHVTADVIRDVVKESDFEFYVCGPPAMMETLVPALERWGVTKERIHMEAFGPATVRKASKPKGPSGGDGQESYAAAATVRFSRSGRKLTWDGTAENLLEFALSNGIEIDSGCRAGSCGTCVVDVKEGHVESDADCQEGTCLACVSIPAGDVVLDA